jgi:hypothetical protein
MDSGVLSSASRNRLRVSAAGERMSAFDLPICTRRIICHAVVNLYITAAKIHDRPSIEVQARILDMYWTPISRDRLSYWNDWRSLGDSNPCFRRERATSEFGTNAAARAHKRIFSGSLGTRAAGLELVSMLSLKSPNFAVLGTNNPTVRHRLCIRKCGAAMGLERTTPTLASCAARICATPLHPIAEI